MFLQQLNEALPDHAGRAQDANSSPFHNPSRIPRRAQPRHISPHPPTTHQLFRRFRKPKSTSRLPKVWDERKLFSVSEVSQSSHLPLILDQVRFRDKGDREPFHFCLDPVSPYLIEGHLSD
jgi:hypothetical protein